MNKFIIVALTLFLSIKRGSEAADYEVEQVKSPYVEKEDIGQMMASGQQATSQYSSQRMFPIRQEPYSSHGRKTRRCLSCHHGMGSSGSYSTGGVSTGGSSYGMSSSYSYGGGYNQPLQTSSKHELKKEQEFVNGQQVYDFHHEKKYKDGQLIDEKRYENSPDDYGVHYRPSGSSGYAALTSSGEMSQNMGYSGLPSSSYHGSSYHRGMHQDFGYMPETTDFSQQFQSDIERMREELRRKTMSIPAQQLPSSPTYGSSHRSEYRTQTKYVNGQPVYVFNEERKYKDGKLIHNVTEEKGPNELGTSGIAGPPSIPSPGTGNIYTNYGEGITRNQPYMPSSTYPGSYSSYSSSSELSNNIGKEYRPPVVYGTSAGQTSSASSYSSSSPEYTSGTHYTRHQTSTGYQPSYHQQPYDRDDDDVDDSYRQPQGPDSYETSYGTSRTQQTNAQYDYDSARPTYIRPSQTTPRPSHYSYGTGREPYASRKDTYEDKQYQKPNEDLYRPAVNTYPYSSQRIKEESQSSYFDSKRNRERPDDHRIVSDRNRIHVVEQAQNSQTRHYRPTTQQPSYTRPQEPERRYGASSYGSRINETSHSYQPESRVTSVTSRREESQRSSSSSYASPGISYRPGRYGNSDDDDDDNDLAGHAGAPTSHVGVPNYPHVPKPDRLIDEAEEQERYDISPYVDGSDADEPENEFETNKVGFEETLSPRHPSRDSTYDRSRSRHYESESHSREHSTGYGYQPHKAPQRVPQSAGPISNPQREYSIQNTSRTDHRVTTVIPSKWTETRTTWKYVDGRMVSETQQHRYYENGVVVHENTTEKSRDEMRDSGVDVESLDLSPSQLAEYGESLPSSTHSQKHEIYQVRRFKNGQQTYELNHEKQFQDGVLVLENKEEKDEDDFEGEKGYRIPRPVVDVDHLRQSHLTDQSLDVGRTDLGIHGSYHTTAGQPKTYTRKHEVRQEEEFVNGQKIYDFHHEREFEDGRLVRENKTELGPDDLGTSGTPVVHRDALKDLLNGRTYSSIAENSLLDQRRTADGILTTSCLTCGSAHTGSTHARGSTSSGHGYSSGSTFRQEESTQTSGSSLGLLDIPRGHGYGHGSSFRHDMEVEEHYENGKLVKGREEVKKWKDGSLVDAKTKHYYDGPSRAGTISTLSSDAASTAAFSSVPSGTVTYKLEDKCSPNPCHNKGRCKTSVRGPVCVCPFGFRGSFCEEAYCPSRYCRYGGSCSISGRQHVCQCLEGYSGYRCSTRVHALKLGVSG